MTKLKKLLQKLGLIFNKKLPLVINVVETLKKFIDSPADDVIAEVISIAIPGSVDDLIVDQIQNTLHEYLPKVLLNLHIMQVINSITDPEERAMRINYEVSSAIADFKYSSDEQKQIFFHGLASLLIEKLSDGKLSWRESIEIAEYGYQYFVKNKV